MLWIFLSSIYVTYLNISFIHCSNASGSAPADGNGGRDDGGNKKDPEVIIDSSATDQQHISNTALAQIGVPDNFPEVPILPVLRNPIFPKFVKLIEVNTLTKS